MAPGMSNTENVTHDHQGSPVTERVTAHGHSEGTRRSRLKVSQWWRLTDVFRSHRDATGDEGEVCILHPARRMSLQTASGLVHTRCSHSSPVLTQIVVNRTRRTVRQQKDGSVYRPQLEWPLISNHNKETIIEYQSSNPHPPAPCQTRPDRKKQSCGHWKALLLPTNKTEKTSRVTKQHTSGHNSCIIHMVAPLASTPASRHLTLSTPTFLKQFWRSLKFAMYSCSNLVFIFARFIGMLPEKAPLPHKNNIHIRHRQTFIDIQHILREFSKCYVLSSKILKDHTE